MEAWKMDGTKVGHRRGRRALVMSVGLPLLLLLGLFTFAWRQAGGGYDWGGEPLFVRDIYSGALVNIPYEYRDGCAVVIGGRPSCAITVDTVNQALSYEPAVPWGERCRFAVVDCDGNAETFLEGFGGYATDDVRFYTEVPASDASEGSLANQWLWSRYHEAGYDGDTVTLPFVILLRDGKMVACTTGPTNLAQFLATAPGD